MADLLPAPWQAAPFEQSLAEEVRQLVARLDSGQRLWLSGYLAGAALQTEPQAAAEQSGNAVVTVLFGSQSGNCERIAKQATEALAARGLAFVLLDMMDCRKTHLQNARSVLVVVSTHGEGVPPDRALPLYELLRSAKAPQLSHVRYSVLALGDSSYEKFCETGKQFDAMFEALGAERLHPRVDCDVDFEASAQGWIDAVVDALARASLAVAHRPVAAIPRAAASVSNAYTRKNPFRAPLLTNQRLTAPSSAKDVRHIEMSLEHSGIRYEPGDAIGVVPRNHTADVQALLEATRFAPETPVSVESHTLPLRQALLESYDIGSPTRAFLQRYAAAIGSAALTELLLEQNQHALRRYLHGRDLIDLVGEHPPVGLDATGFTQLLRPLAPRLYSIASSQRATPDEAHITVSLVEYDSLGRRRRGVASGFLIDLCSPDATVPVYLHRNPNFHLPSDSGAPMIMIGPGVGVAPFRGFVAEREALGARGRNWLFFGDRSFLADFLYQAEWLDWRKRGVLERIDVAFSRDQEQKVYVQHRMRERGRELWAWLEEGAHVYVCGDAEHMAPDVHQALLEIVQLHGGRAEADAAEYLVQLQRERRYQRDVY